MSSTGAKGSQQTNKKTEKGFKYREQKTNEESLFWRTGLSGAPGSSNSELLTFGNSGSRSAIIHRTVRRRTGQCPVAHRTIRCASGGTTTSAPTVACNSIKCATVRAEVRHAPEGAPDSLQDLLSHPVLEGKPNANHVRARIRNSRTQRLHK
jgi:hypothetical protein